LDARAETDADRDFIWLEGKSITFAGMRQRSLAVAAGLLEAGVLPGDRVALLLPNGIEILELFFGCAQAGAIQVPLNAFLKGEFLRYQLRDAQASTLVTDGAGYRSASPLLDELPDLRLIIIVDDTELNCPSGMRSLRYGLLKKGGVPSPVSKVDPEEINAIIYTSGTTGLPKGCMLTHGYCARASQISAHYLNLGPDDTHLTAMPLFHAAARLLVLGAALHSGGKAAIINGFSPSRLINVARDIGATVIGGVGSMGVALLGLPKSPRDRDHQLRLGWFGPFTPDQQTQMIERFGLSDVSCEMYGQTECVPATFSSVIGERNRESVGRPAHDLDIRLVDEEDNVVGVGEVGEIVIRPLTCYSMFRGYWRKPEATLEAFRNLWYHTGDYGRRDENGFIAFVDRKKDAVRRRGENVSSVELEAAIRIHPKVSDVAIHAVPSPLSEDDIKACIVLKQDEEIEPEEIFRFFKTNLPYFAVPRYVEIMSELPRNAVNRVMKHALRERGITIETWDFEQLGFSISKSSRR
jgi:crotonobetaine/carnitine-CoA ligase